MTAQGKRIGVSGERDLEGGALKRLCRAHPSSRVGIASVLVATLLTGCHTVSRVIGFDQQAKRLRQTGRIDGRIDTEGEAEGTLVVTLAREPEPEGEILLGVDTFVRMRPGTFRFGVPPGRYRLGAYEDRNRNGLLDPDERVSANLDNPIIEIDLGEHASQDIILRSGATFAAFSDEPLDVFGLVERTPKEQQRFSLWNFSVQGDVCEDLGAAKFGPTSGPRGLWEIMDFANEGLAGIYFMEPYDPTRVPVLFVHGIGGYPQEFRALIEELDRDRFQPWFYFYPSGFPLDALSTHLATLMERLNIEHGFDEIALVAHSMGGLVSRGAILKYYEETQRSDVRLFVSISTPWGGDESAKSAKAAPIELPPSFLDMDPASKYLRWVFHDGTHPRLLPPSVEHHLVFGFKMRNSEAVADDGTVSVASQLRTEAQEQAISVRGFDLGHVDILQAAEVAARLNVLLDQRFD